MGTTLEFQVPGTFRPLIDRVGSGPFDLSPGVWTDDTSMALCLAESLVECRGFDPDDQMQRYLRWYREGYLSSTGRCFDIGHATRAALECFERTCDPVAGSADPRVAGNGSLMRLVAVPHCFMPDPAQPIVRSGDSSRTIAAVGLRPYVEVTRVLDALAGAVDRHLKKGSIGTFVLPGLLKITAVKKPARKAQKGVPNPFKPGETMDVAAKPASVKVKVIALKKIKDMVG